ncbi:transporter substrate-binding domain-containing protein [Shewanella sp. CG12_big_fil_rev_8_21_14_0_65_47_15]|uniref:substrate-binding periplasmic protein n=1 Tax=Shewanella sp. CG12_big_fil_rev_8_21_14_0_65_47_15 TaxID=1975537 RepID=UPI000CA654CC|nr:transporter substrate-binding domain-containing protein [Shewanella sp. CG12_big_fil_rev_8_21_14_0_65_47_15]PIW62509.1 MAG: hypothetical protein COW15_02820 [Shewanella sp. CG12_big_fil_rev_8_21_14_0_65_47_15]
MNCGIFFGGPRLWHYISLMLLSNLAFAADKLPSVSMSASDTIAPYFLDEHHGIQYELVQSILHHAGLRLDQVVLAPNFRSQRLLSQGEVDCFINAQSGLNGMYYSQPYHRFHDVVAVRTDSAINIGVVADLNGLSVAGFQHAKQVLGAEFLHFAQDNPRYVEVPNQLSQVNMLLHGRVDAIVIEEGVLSWYWNEIAKKSLREPPQLTIFPIFSPIELRIACWDPKLIESLNQGISSMRASAEDNAIIEAFRRQHQMY